jgi:hypothetical protein
MQSPSEQAKPNKTARSAKAIHLVQDSADPYGQFQGAPGGKEERKERQGGKGGRRTNRSSTRRVPLVRLVLGRGFERLERRLAGVADLHDRGKVATSVAVTVPTAEHEHAK